MSNTDTIIKNDELRMTLCRYVPFRRFCEMLFFEQLTLVSPKLWVDKYENYLLSMIREGQITDEFKEQIKDKNQYEDEQVEDAIEFAEGLCSVARCLCFSKSVDEEVMWNAYNYQNETIMWTTTAEKLRNVCSDLMIAKVSYDLESYGSRDFIRQFSSYEGDVAIEDAHEFLTHKRSMFNYENEVRIIDMHMINLSSKFCIYKIPSLHGFIDGVLVHPLAEEGYVKLVERVCDHFNVPLLGKSQIYELKEKF